MTDRRVSGKFDRRELLTPVSAIDLTRPERRKDKAKRISVNAMPQARKSWEFEGTRHEVFMAGFRIGLKLGSE